ncbi:MAG TPA: hypothetical protein PKA31_02780 [Candidatus Moranbacteria bacterium]|nr:hypothetical protein [Candidatus Moranbacteria bacterium]
MFSKKRIIDRIEFKLAEGLWKVCYRTYGKGPPKTWFVFVDDPRRKSINELNKLPRLGKGKTLKQVFAALGIGYIPKTKRLKKKKLKELS